MAGGSYTGNDGIVITHGNSVIMYPHGYDPSKLRLNGIPKERAQQYVLNELQKLVTS